MTLPNNDNPKSQALKQYRMQAITRAVKTKGDSSFNWAGIKNV